MLEGKEYIVPCMRDLDEAMAKGWDELRARHIADYQALYNRVSLDLGVFPFPDRTYGEELVPAGYYRALRITLGEGNGRNWWCVVYPSLCLPETADIDGTVEFYSSIFRWAIRMWEAIVQ